MKKLVTALLLIVGVFALTGCWAGEIGVETTFDAKDGGGSRQFILDVMDDTLSDTPIINPDDPDQTEGKGAVINSTHIDGGVSAIQTWLEENAPDFLTVEPMVTEGVHRYFTLTMEFDDFDDFLAQYGQLVDLSPTLSWADFAANERPTWTCDGSSCTFVEPREILEASMDWAIDGIWNDIYVEADLAGWVTKDSISVLANYTLTVGEEVYEELQHYDPLAVGDSETGLTIYVESDSFTETGEFPMSAGTIALIAGGAVVVLGGIGAAVYFLFLKKKPV